MNLFCSSICLFPFGILSISWGWPRCTQRKFTMILQVKEQSYFVCIKAHRSSTDEKVSRADMEKIIQSSHGSVEHQIGARPLVRAIGNALTVTPFLVVCFCTWRCLGSMWWVTDIFGSLCKLSVKYATIICCWPFCMLQCPGASLGKYWEKTWSLYSHNI